MRRRRKRKGRNMWEYRKIEGPGTRRPVGP